MVPGSGCYLFRCCPALLIPQQNDVLGFTQLLPGLQRNKLRLQYEDYYQIMTNLGLRYYDSTEAPAPWQAQEAWVEGARVWGGYLGGPSAARIWTGTDWTVVRRVGYSLIGYWVEWNPSYLSGLQAAHAAQRMGMDPRWFRICVDQEASWPDPKLVFRDGVRAGGYECGIYGTVAAVARQASRYDFSVTADYDEVPNPPYPGPKRIRQNWNSHDEFGLSVDRGIADPWFYYGVDEMQYMDLGQPLNNADLISRRVKVHEWGHLRGKVVDTEAEMDQLLATWVASGGEAVLAQMMGA